MVWVHTQAWHTPAKYLRVAPTAIWILDYFLTLEHEVRLFSSIGCWNIAVIMFILTRYAPVVWIITQVYAIFRAHSTETCLTSYRISGAALFLIMLAAEGLLLIRILASWHNNKKIKLFLLASYMLVVVSMAVCDILAGFLLEGVCLPTSTLHTLEAATKLERLLMGKFVSAALFELIVITLTIYHSILLRSNGIRSVSRLASTLLKGSLLYTVSLLAISIVNIVSFALPISWLGQGGIVAVFQGVLHGVLASRIFFDLRDLGDTDQDEAHHDDYIFSSYISLPRTQRISQTIPMTILHGESNA